MLTVDANVFVSAASLADVFHTDSDEFLKRIRRFRLPLHCPVLLLPETASGIVRPTGDLLAAQMAVISVQTFPGIQLISLTEARSQATAQIALMCRLRGADAVYIALAQELGTTPITWDGEMLARGAQAVPTMTPTDWLAANSTTAAHASKS